MREWQAEVAVDEALVRRLIGSQFPQLELGAVRLLAEGWDNAVWLVDETWVFRFPRRTIGLPGFERELTLLPRLAPHLALPIPTPRLVGRPAAGYPWPFFGAAHIPGRELAGAGLEDDARTDAADALGRFLQQLHRAELAAAFADELPTDPNMRTDMAVRVPHARRVLGEAAELGLLDADRARMADELLATAASLPPSTAIVLVHGDLHVRHVLVDAQGQVTGVIDWGDACIADPSADLQIGWSAFVGAARAVFLAAYGHVPADRVLRARALALSLCATLAVYAHHEGMHDLQREAASGIGRTLVD